MEKSGIARITEDVNDPMLLFKGWLQEASDSGHLSPSLCCFSTANQNGEVSARNLVLRKLESDGFIIVTDKRSKKVKELLEHPQAAATFLWIYKKDGQTIHRQVRMEGLVHEISPEIFKNIYDKEPLYCKLRAHVCHQGQSVEWENLKQAHDELYKEHKEGRNDLPMPDHYIGFKMVPTMFDFYHAHDNFVADRICYLKEDADQWKRWRVAA